MISTQTIPIYWRKVRTGEVLPPKVRTFLQRNPKLASGLAVALLLLLVAIFWRSCSRTERPELSYYTAKRSDFVVSITEGGSLRAVKEELIRSEVEGTTRIISIVPEGTLVKKGELLVELDSSDIQDKLTQRGIL